MQGSEDEVVKELKHWDMKKSFKAGGKLQGQISPILQRFSILTPLQMIKLPFNRASYIPYSSHHLPKLSCSLSHFSSHSSIKNNDCQRKWNIWKVIVKILIDGSIVSLSSPILVLPQWALWYKSYNGQALLSDVVLDATQDFLGQENDFNFI